MTGYEAVTRRVVPYLPYRKLKSADERERIGTAGSLILQLKHGQSARLQRVE